MEREKYLAGLKMRATVKGRRRNTVTWAGGGGDRKGGLPSLSKRQGMPRLAEALKLTDSDTHTHTHTSSLTVATLVARRKRQKYIIISQRISESSYLRKPSEAEFNWGSGVLDERLAGTFSIKEGGGGALELQVLSAATSRDQKISYTSIRNARQETLRTFQSRYSCCC